MISKPFIKPRRKTVVLGLDGVPCTLLERFTAEGVMPRLARILEKGALSPMTASIPEVSSTSWSTFMTGVNPGRHGIFGFMELDGATYDWRFPNFSDLRSRTLWDIAGERGLTSVVLNIPSTYPAKPLKGKIVAGFVALDLDKAVYPADFGKYLRSVGYRLDVDSRKASTDMDAFVADIRATFQKRTQVIHHIFEAGDWDLFIAAITETDRLHHYLWAAMEDGSHPRHGFFVDFYRELDAFIGDFYVLVGDDTPFVLLSDHGFTTTRQEVYLNAYLRQKGYLRFKAPHARSFQEMEEGSTAFALDPSRIYIHREGRYARGCVGAAQHAELCERITQDLLELEIDGEKVVREVLRGDEIYHGPCRGIGPDLVAMSNEGYDLKGSITRDDLFGKGALTGCHTRDNAAFFVNRPAVLEKVNIVDAGATVLRLAGIDDGSLDGRPLIP